jgi:hypothetical protein
MGNHLLLNNILPLPLRPTPLRICTHYHNPEHRFLHINRPNIHNSRLNPLHKLLQIHLLLARLHQLPRRKSNPTPESPLQ